MHILCLKCAIICNKKQTLIQSDMKYCPSLLSAMIVINYDFVFYHMIPAAKTILNVFLKNHIFLYATGQFSKSP